MRFGRSFAYWFSTLVLTPAFIAASLYIGYMALSWTPLFISKSPVIGLMSLAIGGLLVGFPFYMAYSLFRKSVRYVDVEGSVRLKYFGGREDVISRPQDIYMRTGNRGAQDLMIVGEDGERMINAPYLFKDYKGLFAALEEQSGRPIRYP